MVERRVERRQNLFEPQRACVEKGLPALRLGAEELEEPSEPETLKELDLVLGFGG